MEFLTNKSTRRVVVGLLVIAYFLSVYKFATFDDVNDINIFLFYSLFTFVFIISKYIMASSHDQARYDDVEIKDWPEVAVIIPAYNEGAAIYETIKSLSFSYYPTSKLHLMVVDDGSTDDTAEYLEKARTDFGQFFKITTFNQPENKGKRECMYTGLLETTSEFVIFIDSDSRVDRYCVKELIKPFYSDPNIGGVSGHAYVENKDKNWLTQMQEVRYFNAFRAYKASESLVGYVTCCSGCCSAYKRSAINQIVPDWIDQQFLGRQCTYGDDRSLTNLLLKHNFKTVYNEKAKSYTNVPDNYKQYVKQQLRWKKSWLRESYITLTFMFKKSPWFIILNTLNFVLPFISPFIIARYLVWYGFTNTLATLNYVVGMLITALLIGLYYKTYNKTVARNNKWIGGSLAFQLVNITLFWQIPYALMTLNDTKWGTR